MRLRLYYCLAILVFTGFSSLRAQTVLFSEDFNSCQLSPGWEVIKTGNQNPVWYVDDAIQNDDNNGQSMNGSCFLFIDDDATGNNTPAFVIDFVSPAFDASQFPKVELTVDVHYRDWPSGSESFEVLITDGVTEQLVSRFDEHRSTGNNLYDFVTVRYDLSLLTQSNNVRLIFRYNDANAFNWWAGVDNILVTGSGFGQNVIAESFNACEKPDLWETQILTGVHDWRFGLIDTGQALSHGNSMDGTCFVFFDDDVIGAGAPYSTVRLASPWFDGTQFGYFALSFDVILRYYSEKIAVIVEHGDGTEYSVIESSGDVGGPWFDNYLSVVFDISPYRNKQMRVVFQYDDGQDFGWWAGIDNVKVTGFGAASDICANATQIFTGQTCSPQNNNIALFDGPPAPCVERSAAGLWYTWKADFSGLARLKTHADFNDVVNVFTGDCSSPNLVQCNNRDEHGFTGEDTYFQAVEGQSYLIRVSGREGSFGTPRGNLCVEIQQADQLPETPVNDLCNQAVALTIDAACTTGNNVNGSHSTPLPSYNELARADVWYSFVAPALGPNEILEIQSNANFSDIITVYSGGCNNLTEVAANHKGNRLELSAPGAGQTYLVQIAGTFATIEGELCPQVLRKNTNAPANDNCLDAIDVAVGEQCLAGNNTGATFSGLLPSCVAQVNSDVWYTFTAPASGTVLINTGAEFQHVLAVWQGSCGNMENIFCVENPLRCDGYQSLGSLIPGETYYIQLASQIADAAPQTGNFCLKLRDGALQLDVEPLVLNVEEKCVASDIIQLLLEVEGGVQPYTFQGNQNEQILAAGESYFVVVSDASGCEKSYSAVAKPCDSEGCAVTGMVQPQQPLCYNAANGALSAQITGGIAPYTYKWSNGATTETSVGLPAGVYTVTVTDLLGCEVVISATLINPLEIIAVPNSIQQPYQGESNGAIYVDVAGGNGQFGYSWFRDGVFFVASEDLTSAPAGNYQLQITDGNGCQASFDFTLTEIVADKDVSEAFFTEVFPNPAREKAWLTVSFPSPQTLHLTLSDASGRAIHAWTQRQVQEQNIPLDLKNLPAGTYQLRIRTEKESWVEQVIVVK